MKTKKRILATILAVLTFVALLNINPIFYFLKLGFVFESLIGALLLGTLVAAILIVAKGEIKPFKKKGLLFFFSWGVGLGLILGGLLAIINFPMSGLLNFIVPFFISSFIGIVLGILSEINTK